MEMDCGDSVEWASEAFVAACARCDAEAVEEALDHGPTVEELNLRDRTGKTGLSHLASNGLLGLLQLVEDTALAVDPNLADKEGNTPLIFAAQAGQSDVVGLLLRAFPDLQVDQRNSLGFTALMKAAVQGRQWCAKLLLAAGASPYLRDFGRGFTALQWASYVGRHNTAQLLAHFQDSFPPPQSALPLLPNPPRFATSSSLDSAPGGGAKASVPLTKLLKRLKGNLGSQEYGSPFQSLEDVARVVTSPLYFGDVGGLRGSTDPRGLAGSSSTASLSSALESAPPPQLLISRYSRDDNFLFESTQRRTARHRQSLVNRLRRQVAKKTSA